MISNDGYSVDIPERIYDTFRINALIDCEPLSWFEAHYEDHRKARMLQNLIT